MYNFAPFAAAYVANSLPIPEFALLFSYSFIHTKNKNKKQK
jgi:hypothetical protein